MQPKIGPFPLKYVVLCLLVLQNSLTAILRVARAARARPAGLGSVAVFMAEAIGLPVCTGLIVRDAGGIRPAMKQIYQQVFVKWGDTLRMGVPAACYCVQNLLFFVALTALRDVLPAMVAVKTLFTALFFVVYLGRVLRAAVDRLGTALHGRRARPILRGGGAAAAATSSSALHQRSRLASPPS